MTSLRTKDVVRRHYEGQRLSERKLDQLLELAEQADPAGPSTRRPRRTALLAALATVLVVAFAAAFWLGRRSGSDSGELALAREMLEHHRKTGRTDFPGQDFATLQSALERLEFALIEPDALAQSGLRPVGARYCSLRGQVAARVHLVERDGRSATLCEVPDGDAFADVRPTEVTIDGTTVRIWKEAGLVCALARPIQ